MTKRHGVGLALFAAHLALLWPLLHASSRLADLEVADWRATPTGTGAFELTARVEPPRLRRRARVRIDGQNAEFERRGDGTFAFGVPPTPAPKLREVCIEAAHGGGRERRVCQALLTGPLAAPKEPTASALRIFIPATLIAELAPIAEKSLRAALDEKIPRSMRATLSPKVLTLSLAIGGAGVEARGHAELPDGTTADARLTLGLALGRGGAAKGRLIGRSAETRVTVRGPLVDKAKDLAASVGATLGEWLGDEAGRAAGEALGRSLGSALLEGGLRAALDYVVDREVLPALSEALALPDHLDLGPELGGARVRLSWSTGAGATTYAPGLGLRIGLDFAVPEGAPSPSPRAEPPLPDDPRRGIFRVSTAPPPAPTSPTRALLVDVSPDLASALLFGLWRDGILDRLVAGPAELAAWDARLADLSHRPTSARLLRPPHVEVSEDGTPELALADLELVLAPRAGPSPPLRARVSTRQGLHLSYDEGTRALRLQARTRTLELTCVDAERSGARMRPCFADAVRLARDELRAPSSPLAELFRLPVDAVNPLARPADVGGTKLALETRGVRPSTSAGWVRLEVDARWRSPSR